MFPSTKVIAVDDDNDELTRIVNSLRELGIGCIAYNYPNDIPDAFSAGSVRVIFMDINLLGGNSPGSDPNVFAAPISLIDRIVSETNGPYALITWSDTDLHGRLLARVAATASLASKQPFYSCGLSKAEFAGNPAGLRQEVEKVFSNSPSFGALLDWERRVALASDAVIKDIYGHSASFAGQSPAEKMDRILSQLAVAAFGKVHADAHRFEAVNEALMPILGDALNSQFSTGGSPAIWNAAITKCSQNTSPSADARAALNSAVLIETRTGIPADRRGAILRLPASWLKKKAFAYRFGASLSDIQTLVLQQPAEANLSWYLVQVQAACDFNQPKGSPIPYLLAAVVPPHKKKLSPSVLTSPEFAPAEGCSQTRFMFSFLHGKPCYLTHAALRQLKFETVGRFKDQFVEALSFTHHSHASRPGFLSF